ncbi:ATP-binding protein [Ornithinimicrobium cryptoxanthini]|uniref:AAA family ATPase n=1 Tax=Ornithinimicrobium cryptoxanthini TaxID=2934161 RepID=A0ABY4YL50_9MICO|nr:helix-turn-helix transcriptional regulator [Ornithinimicrobium cryptoxanthini]USQ77357.1 AAA family ATPase [Ornithinimicrobium cryptoxanthini]
MAGIVGRRAEREAIEHLLAQAELGRSGVLVLRGEAGIGKTELLEHARTTATESGFRVETTVGMESEAQFAFAGVHQLCAPLLGRIGVLPDPQQTALGVAFGQRAGPAPDPFLVGLATLNLLAEAADESPLLCLFDDAQWLDQASAQVLAFVARRVGAEHLAMVFALRESTDRGGELFTGLPEVRLAGLDDAEAHALLAAVVRGPLDDQVRDRILAEARGNPLALLELPRSGQAEQLAGGFQLPGALAVPHRIEDAFRQRSATLPAQTQSLLLVAAADPTGDVALLWRAAEHLGIAPEAAAPAESAGLLEINSRVRFRHPLVRSAIYQAAASPEHRRTHGALAAATDPGLDPERRAWHRAQAVLGTDAEAAAELEQMADRARDRGGLAAAAAFLQRAAELSPDPASRARRALEGAHAMHAAGATDAATALLAVAGTGPLDSVQRAQLQLLRAQIAFHLTRESNAPSMLLEAAQMLAPLDAALSRETYLHALDAAVLNGHDAVRIAGAVRSAPPAETPERVVDLLLEGLATALTQGYAAGAPALQHALRSTGDTLCADTGEERDNEDWLWLAGRTAIALFDDELVYAIANRNVRRARETGALAVLPAALNLLAITSVLMGKLGRAGELAAEATAITQDTGGVHLPHAHVILAAWRGDQETTAAHLDATAADAAYPDGSADAAQALYAQAVLHNGLGNYADAQEAAARACDASELALSSSSLPELVEASVRLGDVDQATSALEQFTSRTRASGTQWALGLEAYARGLTSTGSAAEEQYREAIARLSDCRMAPYAARAHLAFGEWLRRERRRQDAREQLRTAHELLMEMGVEAFAARAARELRATGEHPRKRTAQPTDALTAHELHIARLVATGATSREVGTQLFLSPRTIEAHLRSIFAKLGISSRRQLSEMQLS